MNNQLLRNWTRRNYHSPTQQCLQSLKRYNPESVLQLPFWPTDSQSAFVAIHSFHSELQLIPSSVSSGKTLIAKIRYQWWRDAIDSCYQFDQSSPSQAANQIPSNHPLVHILKSSVKKHGLSKYYFTRMINALENHYLEPRFKSTNELVQYSQSTTYSTLSLLLQVLSATKTKIKLPLQTIDHSLSHLSNFITIINLLKRIPYYLKTHQVNFIPIDLMECRDEDLFRLFHSSTNNYELGSSHSRSNNSISLVQSTLLNLLSMADSELIATREVLSLDHSHQHHDLNRFHPSQAHKENRYSQTITVPDPHLMPLFLTAVST